MHVFVHGACSEFDYVFCTCLGQKGFACPGRRSGPVLSFLGPGANLKLGALNIHIIVTSMNILIYSVTNNI